MTPEQEMDEAIARYEKAKANGTLDEEFPMVTKVYKDEIVYPSHTHGEHGSHTETTGTERRYIKEDEGGYWKDANYLQFICLDDGVIYKELEITREVK